jgi:hypothetical protein
VAIDRGGDTSRSSRARAGFGDEAEADGPNSPRPARSCATIPLPRTKEKMGKTRQNDQVTEGKARASGDDSTGSVTCSGGDE